MRETPLITFAKADDAGCGQRDPGDIDYIIHSDALTRWLSNDVTVRSGLLAAELRAMADHLDRGTGPVSVSIEFAHKTRGG